MYKRQEQQRRDACGQERQAQDLICGKNSVLEALRSGRTINKVLLARGQDKAFLREVTNLCRAKGVPCQEVERQHLTALAGEEHRGVVAQVAPYAYQEIEDILALAAQRGEEPLVRCV